jgi:hypothetical protein
MSNSDLNRSRGPCRSLTLSRSRILLRKRSTAQSRNRDRRLMNNRSMLLHRGQNPST